MTSSYYEGWVRARAVLDGHSRTSGVIDEIVIRHRRGLRYRVGRTLVAIGTQLMGSSGKHEELRAAA